MAITENPDGSFTPETIIKDFEEKAEIFLAQLDAMQGNIAADQAIASDSPTNAELVQIINNILDYADKLVLANKKEIKTIRKILRHEQTGG